MFNFTLNCSFLTTLHFHIHYSGQTDVSVPHMLDKFSVNLLKPPCKFNLFLELDFQPSADWFFQTKSVFPGSPERLSPAWTQPVLCSSITANHARGQRRWQTRPPTATTTHHEADERLCFCFQSEMETKSLRSGHALVAPFTAGREKHQVFKEHSSVTLLLVSYHRLCSWRLSIVSLTPAESISEYMDQSVRSKLLEEKPGFSGLCTLLFWPLQGF